MNHKLAKGTVYLLIAQVSIIISGYLIHAGLGRAFGPSLYGTFAVILSIMLITKSIFLTGNSMVMSKIISQDPTQVGIIMKAGIKLQLIQAFLSILFFLIFSSPAKFSLINSSS